MKPEHVELIKTIFRCKHEKTFFDEIFFSVADRNISIGDQYFLFDAVDIEKLIAAIEAPKDAELAKEKRYNAELSTDAEWANDRLLALITFVDYYAETNLGGDEEVPILALGNAIDMLDDAIEVIKGVRQANVLLRERIKELEAAHFHGVTKMGGLYEHK